MLIIREIQALHVLYGGTRLLTEVVGAPMAMALPREARIGPAAAVCHILVTACKILDDLALCRGFKADDYLNVAAKLCRACLIMLMIMIFACLHPVGGLSCDTPFILTAVRAACMPATRSQSAA